MVLEIFKLGGQQVNDGVISAVDVDHTVLFDLDSLHVLGEVFDFFLVDEEFLFHDFVDALDKFIDDWEDGLNSLFVAGEVSLGAEFKEERGELSESEWAGVAVQQFLVVGFELGHEGRLSLREGGGGGGFNGFYDVGGFFEAVNHGHHFVAVL